MLLWLCLLLGGHSGRFAHRTLDGPDYRPWRNGVWVGAVVAAVALQLLFGLIGLGAQGALRSLALAPWFVYLVGLGALLLAHVVDSVVKRHDRRGFERRNKYLYLEFTTM